MTEQQHSYSCGGLSRVELSIELWCKDNRIQASVNWSQEAQHHHSILHLGGGLSSCRIVSQLVAKVMSDSLPPHER